MSRSIQLLPAYDFTGGLNLDADAFQLRGTQSPDLLNVDLDPRGGFRMRDGLTTVDSQLLPFVPENVWTFQSTTGTQQILVQQGSQFAYSTGDEFTQVRADALVTTGVMRTSVFKDNLYIMRNAEQPAIKWSGSAAAVLGTAFNDSLAAPTAGNMPKARFTASWGGYVWVASTVEGASTYKNRVRWSHPNQPEDFRTLDYIDIDTGRDGDEITAIVPLSDRLVIFKANSIYYIFGHDPSTFSVRTLTNNVGAISQEAVATLDNGLYFFHWPQGLFHIPVGGRDVRLPDWQFQELWPALQAQSIPGAVASGITVSALRRRVWVSVPWLNSTANDRTYVLDPALRRRNKGNGGYTRYSCALGPAVEYHPMGQQDQYLACHATKGRLLKLHQSASARDELRSDGLVLSGASGSCATSPDTALTSHVGDMEIRAGLIATDWTPASAQTIRAKWETTGGQRSYSLSLDTAGKLLFEWSADGTTVLSALSTVAVSFTDATLGYVRASLKVGNPWQVLFYTSTDGQTWTALGAAVNGGVGTSVFDSTALNTVGARLDLGTDQPFIGTVLWSEVSADLVGTDQRTTPDFTAQVGGTTSFTDSAGAVWTLLGDSVLTYESPYIESFYVTRWFDADQPAVIKRWRRPEIALKAGVAMSIRVDSWRDYDPFTLKSTAVLTTETTDGVMVWDDGTHAAHMKWGGGAWAGSDAASAEEQISKISVLGRGRSVRLKFTGPTDPSIQWQIDAITFKYIPRRVRA